MSNELIDFVLVSVALLGIGIYGVANVERRIGEDEIDRFGGQFRHARDTIAVVQHIPSRGNFAHADQDMKYVDHPKKNRSRHLLDSQLILAAGLAVLADHADVVLPADGRRELQRLVANVDVAGDELRSVVMDGDGGAEMRALQLDAIALFSLQSRHVLFVWSQSGLGRLVRVELDEAPPILEYAVLEYHQYRLRGPHVTGVRDAQRKRTKPEAVARHPDTMLAGKIGAIGERVCLVVWLIPRANELHRLIVAIEDMELRVELITCQANRIIPIPLQRDEIFSSDTRGIAIGCQRILKAERTLDCNARLIEREIERRQLRRTLYGDGKEKIALHMLGGTDKQKMRAGAFRLIGEYQFILGINAPAIGVGEPSVEYLQARRDRGAADAEVVGFALFEMDVVKLKRALSPPAWFIAHEVRCSRSAYHRKPTVAAEFYRNRARR